jgi:phytoene dehydrogenase-like protein
VPDAITVRAWEDSLGVPPLVREYAIEPLALAALNEDPNMAAARPFAAVLRALAMSGGRGSAIGFANTGLGDTYAGAAAGTIERAGGLVRTGEWVSGLLVREGRATGVELAGGEELEADAVVCAVPPWDLAPLAASVPALAAVAGAAGSFKASPILTVHLWWDRSIHPGRFAGLAASKFDWLFNRTAIVGSTAGKTEHLCLVKSAAGGMLGKKPEELAEMAEEETRRYVPASAGAKVVRARTVWETKATVSLIPGTGRLRPGTETPVKGLVLAGDWTDTGLPATIESAVKSGMTAARRVMDVLGGSRGE